MHAMTTELGLDVGPLPIIQCRYRTVRSTALGRLCARRDAIGTLHLSFRARDARGRERPIDQWRAGPLRTCPTIIEALGEGLRRVGEDASPTQVLVLARRIDRHIANRLLQYVALRDGRYEQYASRVEKIRERSAATTQLPHFLGWVVATAAATRIEEIEAGDAGAEAGCGMHPVRESFLLLRRGRRWQLWRRLERADCGSMPSRHHALLCQTDLDLEEPALLAELMLYVLMRDRGCGPGTLSCSLPGLLPPARIELLEGTLAEVAAA